MALFTLKFPDLPHVALHVNAPSRSAAEAKAAEFKRLMETDLVVVRPVENGEEDTADS